MLAVGGGYTEARRRPHTRLLCAWVHLFASACRVGDRETVR